MKEFLCCKKEREGQNAKKKLYKKQRSLQDDYDDDDSEIMDDPEEVFEPPSSARGDHVTLPSITGLHDSDSSSNQFIFRYLSGKGEKMHDFWQKD